MKSNTGAVAKDVLDREFLDIRSRLLDLAAALDRLDRASGSIAEDPRLDRIQQGIDLLIRSGEISASRAEQIQLLFSQPYDPHWRNSFEL
jgi:hypothetical protein